MIVRFLSGLIILSFFLAGILFFMGLYSIDLLILFFVFLIGTSVSFLFLKKSMTVSSGLKFQNYLILSSTVKLLLYLSVFLFFTIYRSSVNLLFAFVFISMYFIFTAYEIAFLLFSLKKYSKKH
jgi:hypothetical protein